MVYVYRLWNALSGSLLLQLVGLDFNTWLVPEPVHRAKSECISTWIYTKLLYRRRWARSSNNVCFSKPKWNLLQVYSSSRNILNQRSHTPIARTMTFCIGAYTQRKWQQYYQSNADNKCRHHYILFYTLLSYDARMISIFSRQYIYYNTVAVIDERL